MVPAMEAMGIRMLLNECEVIARGDQRTYLAGIDDAHFFARPAGRSARRRRHAKLRGCSPPIADECIPDFADAAQSRIGCFS
jgi:hypothetical protein